MAKQSTPRLAQSLDDPHQIPKQLPESQPSGDAKAAKIEDVNQGEVANTQLELVDLKLRRLQLLHRIQLLKSQLHLG